MELFAQGPQIDFMSRRNIAIFASALLILAGIASLVIKGGPDLGVEFTGGTLVELKFDERPSLGKIRSALEGVGQKESLVQQFGEEREVLIRLGPSAESGQMDQVVAQALSGVFPPGSFEIRRVEAIGPQVSGELMRKALFAIFYSLLGILVYIGLRFKFAWGLGGVVALLHDLLITVGVLSLVGREWSMPVVAAFLTIAGFSINDTIVVLDRMRENLRLHPREALSRIINLSVNQTLSRTIITNGTVFVVTVALFFWGGPAISDFSFAMVIGTIVGTYSSIFIAAPVVLFWHKGKR